MAKSTTDQPTAETKVRKERRPSRTVEEQIADLQAKADARKAKVTAKAAAQLTVVNDKISTTELKLAELYTERTQLREILGIPEDEIVADVPADEPVSIEG